MSTKLDLQQLSIDRGGQPQHGVHPSRRGRHWFSRFVLPLGVVLGFLVLIGVAAGRRLLPVRSVTVVPVIAKRAEVRQAGQPLFQAPGWVEPRPTVINVPALAPGIVEVLRVVEGQHVAKGETIAKLVAIDAELAVKLARAALAIRKGEYERALAEHRAAQLRVERPVHLHVLIAAAENELSAARSELEQLPFLIKSAEAEFDYTRENAAGKQAAGEGVSGVVKQRANADFNRAEAKLRELQSREPNLRSQAMALQRKVTALKEQLELMIEEKRQLEEAQAKVATAAALRDEAEVRLEQAELQRSRMIIRSPANGRVLRLVASPGDRVMGMDATAEHRSSTIIQMYDPARLQVRVDVRLEDVPLVIPGQPVEIQTAASPAPISGRVLQPTSSANIQKNTLEVKVTLVDPPPSITPEMLVTTTFLAPSSESSEQTSAESQRLFVPVELVNRSGGAAYVWIVDADARVDKAVVTAGLETGDGLIEIVSGLNLTDKLIANPDDDLAPGEPVTVAGDDQGIGLN